MSMQEEQEGEFGELEEASENTDGSDYEYNKIAERARNAVETARRDREGVKHHASEGAGGRWTLDAGGRWRALEGASEGAGTHQLREAQLAIDEDDGSSLNE
eukprot:7437389-Pyramimonas_sp.AAC.1